MSIDSRIIDVLMENELDAIITSDQYNTHYISGFSGGTGFLYISKNRITILTDSRYTLWAKEQAKDGVSVQEINSKKGYVAWLTEYLTEENVKKLGFDNISISYAEYKKLKDISEDIELIEINDSLSKLRQVKSSFEIENIKKAEHIGDIAFKEILNYIKPGLTEQEIAAKLEYIMKTNGAEGLSFETIVASGLNSSKPHAVPSEKKLEAGDFVTMDFGCLYKGYCSDMTRTIVIDNASEEQKKVYNTVLEAQKRALDTIKAGLKCSDIDKVARDYINTNGYEGAFGHGLGHSLGLYIHESPALSPSCDAVLIENMLETVEPGIYIEGFGGVRIEDLVIVTKDGHINLTESEKELIIL